MRDEETWDDCEDECCCRECATRTAHEKNATAWLKERGVDLEKRPRLK